jgi:hypothetical protein
MGTVLVERCPTCRQLVGLGELYAHTHSGACQANQIKTLEEYRAYSRQRAEDFDDELGRTTKKNRQRVWRRQSTQLS